MSGIDERIKVIAAALHGKARVRLGMVSATRADKNAVKVMIQPEEVETGWIPVMSLLVGNGWGLVTKPPHGTQVIVLFQEDDLNNGIVIGCLFDLVNLPPSTSIKDGEFWLVHQTGSLLTLTSDGKMAITSHSDMNLTAGGNMNFNATGNIQFQKTVNVSGDVDSTGTVNGTTDVKVGTISLKTHVHPGVTSGPSLTGTPQ